DPPATAEISAPQRPVASNITRTLGPDTTGTGLPTAFRQPDTISPTRHRAAAPPDGHQFAKLNPSRHCTAAAQSQRHPTHSWVRFRTPRPATAAARPEAGPTDRRHGE